MPDDDDDEDLSSQSTTDKYRARSRSVATLTAAAAGALAAGLALNPASVAFPLVTRILGLATIVLLIFATGAFVVAAVLHARSVKPGQKPPPVASRVLRPWEALFASENEWPSLEEYRESVEAVERRIMLATDIGMWLATAAIASLVAALISMAVLNEERTTVFVSVAHGTRAASLCPNLPAVFAADVRTVELDSTTDALTLRVAGSECRSDLAGKSVSVTIARTDVLVIQRAAA